MTLKDWILLLVPICFNGLIVFVLQKIFEKRHITRSVRFEYASKLREMLDISLALHAKATRLANEKSENNDDKINEILYEYVNSALDVYYYYIQNKIIFKSLEQRMEKLAEKILKLVKSSEQAEVDYMELSLHVNEIRDEMMSIKDDCINLRF